MTRHTLKMPRLGETMEAGLVVRWHKEAGEAYRRGESLLDIETDKTVAEYPALSDGVLLKILADFGTSVKVGEPIAEIEVDTPESVPSQPNSESQSSPDDAPLRPQIVASPSAKSKVRASPAARALARDNHIALELAIGTGPRGRVERCDIEALISARQKRKTDVKLFDTDTGQIAYMKAGSAGPCHLLLHGFGGDMSTWVAVASELEREGQQVVTPDLPAHGKTEMRADNLDELADAIHKFADALPERFHLVGLSMGAAVAVELARRIPQRVISLVLASPAGLGYKVATDFVTGMANAKTAEDITKLLAYLGPRAELIFGTQARINLAQETSRGRLRELAQVLIAEEGLKLDIRPLLTELSMLMPVKVVLGLQDKVFAVANIPELPPLVALHVLAEAGHVLHWDQSADFVDLLLDHSRKYDAKQNKTALITGEK